MTYSLVKISLGDIDNIKLDTEGRPIVFDICDITIGNFYVFSGTDGLSRNKRENFFAEVIPQLLINKQEQNLFISCEKLKNKLLLE